MLARIRQDAEPVQFDTSPALSYFCAPCLVLSKHLSQFVVTYYLGFFSLFMVYCLLPPLGFYKYLPSLLLSNSGMGTKPAGGARAAVRSDAFRGHDSGTPTHRQPLLSGSACSLPTGGKLGRAHRRQRGRWYGQTDRARVPLPPLSGRLSLPLPLSLLLPPSSPAERG